MRIECKKRVEGYKPVKGNEEEIINHLLNLENVVYEVCMEGCKIDRYEKTQYKQLKLWELKDRLNQTRAIVSVYDLPDDIAEEIIDYSLKLIEEGEMK